MEKGLTLIEILLVVSIMSIITLLSAPFYARFFTQNAVEATTSQLISSFRKAQIYSMAGKQNSPWSVNYDPSGKKITLYKGSTFAGHDSSFDEVYTVNNNVSITGFTNNDVEFSRIFGTPDNTSTITISGDNTTRTVTINSQGVVSR